MWRRGEWRERRYRVCDGKDGEGRVAIVCRTRGGGGEGKEYRVGG